MFMIIYGVKGCVIIAIVSGITKGGSPLRFGAIQDKKKKSQGL